MISVKVDILSKRKCTIMEKCLLYNIKEDPEIKNVEGNLLLHQELVKVV